MHFPYDKKGRGLDYFPKKREMVPIIAEIVPPTKGSRNGYLFNFFHLIRMYPSRDGFFPAETVEIQREMLHPLPELSVEMETIGREMECFLV